MCWPAFDAGPLGNSRSRVVRSALTNVPARENCSSAEPARCRLGGKIRNGVPLVNPASASRCWEQVGDSSAPAAKRASRGTRLLGWIWLSGLLFLCASGCRQPDEIISYTVAKPPAREPRPVTEEPATENVDRSGEAAIESQLLGAILPRGETTWFFKLLGSRPAMETQTNSFVQFVRSIKFSKDRPEWALPEGWKEEPAAKMRFATLRISTDEGPLELSVIPLPTGPGKIEEYVLSNVNRWREQVKLPLLAQEELPANVVKFDLDGATAWLVNFVGIVSGQPMGTAGVAG